MFLLQDPFVPITMIVIYPTIPSLAALFTAIFLVELEMAPSADTHCGLEGTEQHRSPGDHHHQKTQ